MGIKQHSSLPEPADLLREDERHTTAELVELAAYSASIIAGGEYRLARVASLIHEDYAQRHAEEQAMLDAASSQDPERGGMSSSVAELRSRVAARQVAERSISEHRPDGMTATIAELGAALTATPARIRELVRAGDAMRYRLPFTSSWLACGRMDLRRFLIAVARTDLCDYEAIEEIDQELAMLIGERPPMSVKRFTAMVDAVVAKLDPESVRERRRRAGAERKVSVRPDPFRPGQSRISGSLPTDRAAEVGESLETLARSVHAADPRTLEQRRADALVALTRGRNRLECLCDDCVAMRAAELAEAGEAGGGEAEVADPADVTDSAGTVDPADIADPADPVGCSGLTESGSTVDGCGAAESPADDAAVTDGERSPAGERAADQAVGEGDSAAGSGPGEPGSGESRPDEPEPDEPKLDEPKPDEPSPGEAEPDESKPGEPKPDESKPGEPKPGDPAGDGIGEASWSTEGEAATACSCGGADEPTGAKPWFHIVVNLSSLIGLDELPAHLDGQGVIDAATARDLLAGAKRSFVAGAPQRSRGYSPSPKLAEAVRVAELTCTFPGCDTAVWRCDLDHTEPYDHGDPAAGGATCRCNLKPLCRLHHRIKTFTAWTDFQDGMGRAWFVSDTGKAFWGNAFNIGDLWGITDYIDYPDPASPAHAEVEALRRRRRHANDSRRRLNDEDDPPPF